MRSINTSPKLRTDNLAQNAKWLLIGVTLLAISLRIWGINFGLPYLYHPDEPVAVRIAQRMFETGDLNPRTHSDGYLWLWCRSIGLSDRTAIDQEDDSRIAGCFNDGHITDQRGKQSLHHSRHFSGILCVALVLGICSSISAGQDSALHHSKHWKWTGGIN